MASARQAARKGADGEVYYESKGRGRRLVAVQARFTK
jgi:hypothetical protein